MLVSAKSKRSLSYVDSILVSFEHFDQFKVPNCSKKMKTWVVKDLWSCSNATELNGNTKFNNMHYGSVCIGPVLI